MYYVNLEQLYLKDMLAFVVYLLLFYILYLFFCYIKFVSVSSLSGLISSNHLARR
jgi:hypothetical protein